MKFWPRCLLCKRIIWPWQRAVVINLSRGTIWHAKRCYANRFLGEYLRQQQILRAREKDQL